MKTTTLVLVLAAALFAATPANAQFSSEFTLTATAPSEPIAYAGSAEVPVKVTVGCRAVLENLGPSNTVVIDVHAEEPPAWLTVAETELEIDVQACLTGITGTATATGALTFTVDATAPGVVDQVVALEAHLGDLVAPVDLTFTVAYFSSYTVVADAVFPLKVTNGVAFFNVTTTQNSNARSMIMFENVEESAGKISGLASIPYNTTASDTVRVPCGASPPKEDSRSKVFCIKYLAPTGPWTEAKVTFTNFGHFLLLDQRAGDYMDAKTVTWTFTNGGGEAATEGSNDAPLPLPFLALGFAAFVAARRKT
ncbi:MAG: hypothetical protein AABX89_04505 [Candidatus Thermoplasmatota archaeon]